MLSSVEHGSAPNSVQKVSIHDRRSQKEKQCLVIFSQKLLAKIGSIIPTFFVWEAEQGSIN